MIKPLCIKGASFTLHLDCPSSTSAGKNISCKLYVKQTGGVSAVNGKFDLGSTKFMSFDKKGTYDVSMADKECFTFGKVDGFPDSITLGNLTVTIPSTAKPGDTFTIKVTNISATDLEYNDLSQADIVRTIKIKSNINTLSSLSITGSDIEFEENNLSYSATIDSDSVTIKATPKDSNASVSGTGKKTLKYGKNTLNVVVTAEDGSKKTYVLNITRPDNRNNNNYLKSLTISNAELKFNKDVTLYDINVDKNISTIKISAEVEDEKATFVKKYGPRSVKLKYGKNEILIKVSAENEKVRTYTINVNRKDGRSNDNTLSSLSITPGNIIFNKNTTSYYINVDSTVEEIGINAETSDSKAKIKIEKPDSLLTGKNEYKVIVTAEDGTSRTYQLFVTKGESVHEPSGNNNAKIVVKGYNINFDPNIADYTLVTTDKSLDVDVITEDVNAKYEIIGNKDLISGSIVKIVIIAENGSKKYYSIKTIEKELTTPMLISMITITLANVILACMLIFKKKAS